MAIDAQDVLRPDFLLLMKDSPMRKCCKNSYTLVRMSLIEAIKDRTTEEPRPKRKLLKIDG